MASKMRHARAKHALKHKRAHSKVGNRQYGICSCIRCGGDVAVEAPLFENVLRLCDGCKATAEMWRTAQNIVQRKVPVTFGTYHEKHGFKK